MKVKPEINQNFFIIFSSPLAGMTQRGVMISITQSDDPLEYAIAKRAKGILKTE